MSDGQHPIERTFRRLTEARQEEFASAADFKTRFLQEETDHTFDSAVLGGGLADRVAYAFAAGYQSALKALLPTLRSTPETCGDWASFCITEEAGNSPKVLTSTLTPEGERWRLNGTKTFVTGCQEANILLIAASTGVDQDGRKQFRMACIDKEREGISITDLPELPFVPEISHGIVHCQDVLVNPDELLPKDGYVGYVKPFRTIEDLHVSGALLGYIANRALATKWPTEIFEQIMALVLSHRSMASLSPLSPSLHVALAGARTQFEQLIQTFEPVWKERDPEHFQTWQRDKQLLKIAGSARKKRTETAWRTFIQSS